MDNSPNQRIYIAAPYSHPEPAVRRERVRTATRYAAELIRRGCMVYSPLTHSAPISSQNKKMPGDWEFWSANCLSFLQYWATRIHVLQLPGWKESVGIKNELAAAYALGVPAKYISLPGWAAPSDIILKNACPECGRVNQRVGPGNMACAGCGRIYRAGGPAE